MPQCFATHTHRPFLNYSNLMVPSVLVLILWIITIINIVLGGSLSSFGVSPRLFPLGLIGIFSAPFIHSSLAHMGANTIPFFVTGAIINGTRGTAHFLALSAAIAISSGLMVWTFGRTETTHVGASGVIFGYVGFLCVAAAIHRDSSAPTARCRIRNCKDGSAVCTPQWCLQRRVSWSTCTGAVRVTPARNGVPLCDNAI